MALKIHPTACVDPEAWLDDDVEVGPFCHIGPEVGVGRGTKFISHVSVRGNVRIGVENVFHPHCVIGGEPQDFGYKGAPTWVTIGDRNVFREACTVHRATTKEIGVTSIGSHNFLMGGVHIGHDGCVGNNVTIANNTLLGGHARVEDFASISGGVGVHQFVTVGCYAFVGGLSRLAMDAPPYMLVEGNPSEVRCINLVGLKRRGFTHQEIRSLASAHRMLYRMHMGAAQSKDQLTSAGQFCAPVAKLFEFLDNQHSGRRGRAREGRRAA